MAHSARAPWRRLLALLLLSSALLLAAPLAAPTRAQTGPQSLQAAFDAAAREFGVPPGVLLAVSYNLSRWEMHGGAPSTWGGYGPMHLTAVDRALLPDGKGDGVDRSGRPLPTDASFHTLDRAATLLGVSPDVLKRDPAQNIRGGAALLREYARQSLGRVPADPAAWYGAVALYSGASEASVALGFADTVYATIRQGMARTTSDGQAMALAAADIRPDTHTADALPLQRSVGASAVADCPPTVSCEFVPAAYTQNDPADPSDYGNYDLANRPADGLDIRYIVIHDTEIPYATTLTAFQNPRSYVSSHYVLRSSDGHIAQMVENQNVAWHAGNWYVNGHSIGFEHEGVAIQGAAWYTEALYQASARLARYLADKYGIPLDRAHIIGHDDIPHPTTLQQNMHWDPGPFWDWEHYMALMGAPITPDTSPIRGDIVTIRPGYAGNVETVLDCEGDNSPLSQPVSFVYLHTAPDVLAPLVSNPYLTSDPRCANNWGSKAAAGQQFVRVEQRGDWTAIWFGGQTAWFQNPGGNTTAVAKRGRVITPKAGLESIPVYGRAYPEAEAYADPAWVQAVTPIDKYTLPAGQRYVAFGPIKADYYRAPTYAATLAGSDHVVVEGQTEYYQIFFNHRFAFVRADQVDAASSPPLRYMPLISGNPASADQ